MNQKKPFTWVTYFFMFSLVHIALKAQEPIILDSKMKPGISNDMRIEELKVRWKKAALENCPGVPCVTTAVPGAPTAVVATAGNASASVVFVAPTNNGGSTITGYTVRSNPGNITATGATSPINVTGLTNGTAYTFTVVATNAVGNSIASAASTAVTPQLPAFVCGTVVTDIDGNPYNTVLIGTQCWFKENLKVGKYNDGTDIHLDATGGSAGNGVGESWSGLPSGAKTVYAHNSTYLNDLGYLYNWYAAVDNRGICPDGWKVPTKLEWQSLVSFLSTGGDAGLKMMVTSTPYGWATFSKTNLSGFTALSSGYRLGNGGNPSVFGRFLRAGVPGASGILYARWWSTDSVSPTSKDEAVLEDQNSGGFYLNTSEPSQGASIRCIKN